MQFVPFLSLHSIYIYIDPLLPKRLLPNLLAHSEVVDAQNSLYSSGAEIKFDPPMLNGLGWNATALPR